MKDILPRYDFLRMMRGRRRENKKEYKSWEGGDYIIYIFLMRTRKKRKERVMAKERERSLAFHDNNSIIMKYQGVFILTPFFASISAPR